MDIVDIMFEARKIARSSRMAGELIKFTRAGPLARKQEARVYGVQGLRVVDFGWENLGPPIEVPRI